MVKSTSKTKSGKPKSISDRSIALILAALTLALYLRTLAPDLLAGDPGEFQVAAWTFGLSHPTGYPLYMLLGGGWQHLLGLLGISPAYALNAFSALVGSVTIAFLYLLMVDWLPGTRIVRSVAAAFTALLFATNPTVWNQSLIAEVYTLHALFMVLIFWAARRWALGSEQRGERPEEPHPLTPSPLHLVTLSLLIGLSFAHHAMTLLLVPGLVLFLILHFSKEQKKSGLVILSSSLLLLFPLALYLYIPLRSGPAASPWYHQNLGGEILTLYDNSWPAFVDFITGRSISVGFRSFGDALGQLSFALGRWQIHFTRIGIVLIIIGLAALLIRRNWSVLLLTGVAALLQQLFNLFYGIGDIHVYYIPLYLIGAIWCGFAAAQIGEWGNGEAEDVQVDKKLGIGIFIVLFLFLLPVQQVQNYQTVVDQSENRSTRLVWEMILDAHPPDDAILISNDRNEIVPLFYLQQVDNLAAGMSGLFPLMAPDARFTDVGATVETAFALGAGRPVYLIKPMPGLAAKFAMAERTPPLVEVLGPAIVAAPKVEVGVRYGPLTLLGYDLIQNGSAREKNIGENNIGGNNIEENNIGENTVQVDLYWRVEEALAADYTTTVQLYDAAQQRIAQDDRPPGAEFYPTSLWKPGEVLLDSHTLAVDGDATDMLVGMYVGPAFDSFAPPLEIRLVGE